MLIEKRNSPFTSYLPETSTMMEGKLSKIPKVASPAPSLTMMGKVSN